MATSACILRPGRRLAHDGAETAEARRGGPATVCHHALDVVLAAANEETPEAAAALERLCCTYWYPLYAYVRHRGHSPEDSKDLTQEFFHRLLQKNFLAQVDPRKGKFRSFLLAAVNHFLANEWDRARTLKRGGKMTFLPLETPGRTTLPGEPCAGRSPEACMTKPGPSRCSSGCSGGCERKPPRPAREKVRGVEVSLGGKALGLLRGSGAKMGRPKLL